MKRSEMVNILAQELLLHCATEYPHDSYVGYDRKQMAFNDASVILSTLEGAGMIPPEVKAFGEEPNQAIFENVWEPE